MAGSVTKRNDAFAITIIGILFFVFGFITWANSQLIPYLRISCELTVAQSYLVATAFFAAYFVMAIPSSMILKATGFKKRYVTWFINDGSGCTYFYSGSQ